MDRKTGLAATLLLVSGLFYRSSTTQRSPTPSPAAPAESTPAQTSAPSSSEQGPWTPVCNHFKLEESADQPKSVDFNVSITGSGQNNAVNSTLRLQGSQNNKEADPLTQFCVAPAHAYVRRTVLIATVPDPELTHLALTFDRFVESIAWAVADGDGGLSYAKEITATHDNRYSFESYWFPWRPETPQDSDPDKRAAHETDREKRLAKPGLLLFHGVVDPNQLLLVFLVGETPTSGINRVAFHKAWQYAAALKSESLPICPPASKGCLGILGPSFSGSVASFSTLLNDLRNESLVKRQSFPEDVFLLSGSTTSPPIVHVPSLHFCTAVESDADSLNALRRYIDALHPLQRYMSASGVFEKFIKALHVSRADTSALLIETETGYGTEISKEIASATHSSAPNWTVLRYPRGIATLRNSSEQQLPQISDAAPQPSAQNPQLPLSLRDSGKDAIPAQSNAQTPVSQEAVLLEIASTIKREGIRQVGVIGTDPLDGLFLIRFVHSADPNTRVIAVNSDLLYARAAQKWNLRGMLAVTSYPLLSRNQYFSGVQNPRRTQFASADSEGEYNACRRFLLPASTEPRNWHRHPDPLCNSDLTQDRVLQDYLLDYASPVAGLYSPDLSSHSHKPSVWITVLGREAWWPVAAYDPEPSRESMHRSTLFQGPQPAAHQNEMFTVEETPPVWFIFFWIICAACTCHIAGVALMNNAHRYHAALWRSPRLRVLAWRYDADAVRRRFYLASASLIVAVACALLVITIYSSGLTAYGVWELLLAAIIALAATVEVVWLALGAKWRWWIFAATVVSLITVIWIATPDAGNATQFAAYRSIHVESGTSPLLPVTLALFAIYLFLWFRLQQLRRQEDRSPILPDPNSLGLPLANSDVEHLSLAKKNWIARGAVGILLLWWFLFNPVDALSTLERPAYRHLIVSIVSVLIYLLAWTVLRFFAGWGLLRTLLQALERHPLRYAFSRLPKDFSWTSIWTGDPHPNFQAQTRSLDTLRTLIPKRDLESLAEKLAKLDKPDRDYRNFTDPWEVEMLLNYWAEVVARDRLSKWQDGLIDSIAVREDKDKVPKEWSKDKTAIASEELLALRYVAFIRFGLRQMRSSFEFLSYGFILLVLALNVYPFQGHHEIDIVLVFAFILLAGSVITAFAQMDRDPLLSRLSDSKPNALDRNFVWRVISFAALPLLTLLASLVPQFGNFLSSWIEPTLQALK